jgi:hypothetical protein
LADKHNISLTFMDRVAQREGKARLRLRFEIHGPDGKLELSTIILVDEGGAPFTRVEQQGDKISLLMLSCRTS